MKNYMFNHLPRFKYLVLEISPDMFWRSADESWNPVLENAVGYAYDANHNFWTDSIPDGFMEAVKDAPKPISVLMHPYDFENFLLPSTSWYGPDVLADTTSMSFDDHVTKGDWLEVTIGEGNVRQTDVRIRDEHGERDALACRTVASVVKEVTIPAETGGRICPCTG